MRGRRYRGGLLCLGFWSCLLGRRVLVWHYGADSFAMAVNAIYRKFSMLLLLMKGYDVDESIDGFMLQLIGEQTFPSLSACLETSAR